MGAKNNTTTGGNSTEIDTLSLNIEVKGADSGKSVRSLATAISRLNETITNVNTEEFQTKFASITSSIQPFLSQIQESGTEINNLSTIVKTGVPNLEKTSVELRKLSKSYKDISTQAKQATKEIKKVQKETKKPKKDVDENTKAIKANTKAIQQSTGPLKSLVKSFGRIAFYRAVRRAIQEITQAFTSSVDGIASFDDQFRETMGTLQSSINIAKSSMGVALYQGLIAVEPLITRISMGIANLANSISKVSAKMRGESEYLKVNTDYWKEYQSAINGTLLSFDTFTTLSSNQSIDYSKMFDYGETALDEDSFSETEKTIEKLITLLTKVWDIAVAIGAKFIEIVRNINWNPIIDTIKNIADWLLKIIQNTNALKTAIIAIVTINITKKLSNLGIWIANIITKIKEWNTNAKLAKTVSDTLKLSWKSLAVAGAAITTAAISIISNWDEMSDKQKEWVTYIAGLTAALAALAFAAFAATQQWAKAISVAAGVITAGATVLTAVSAFADGGMMTNASRQFTGAGTMYALAGESGAEVVAQGSAGTGVLNVDQFADAMVSALVRYGAARDTSNGTTIVLDGNKVGQLVASNVGFRNEANRRNAGLNWK